MKAYYFADNNVEKGPYTIDELKEFRIKDTTLVWTEGMEEWKPASSVIELSNIIHKTPPPLPERPSIPKKSRNQAPKFDRTVGRFYGLTVVGVALLIFNLVLALLPSTNINTEGIYGTELIFILFTLRILLTVWSSNTAVKQNRSKDWAFLIFFLPSIGLIIQGLLRRKLYSKDYYSLNDIQKAKINYNYAFKFNLYGYKNQALYLINEAIELNSEEKEFLDEKEKILKGLKDN